MLCCRDEGRPQEEELEDGKIEEIECSVATTSVLSIHTPQVNLISPGP